MSFSENPFAGAFGESDAHDTVPAPAPSQEGSAVQIDVDAQELAQMSKRALLGRVNELEDEMQLVQRHIAEKEAELHESLDPEKSYFAKLGGPETSAHIVREELAPQYAALRNLKAEQQAYLAELRHREEHASPYDMDDDGDDDTMERVA